MKRLIIFLTALSISLAASAQAKYVFYFIGDGMGANQVQLTEMFLAASKGELGIEPLCFGQFPVATMSTHFSANSDVTDSAASGTALATGHKTKNSRIGMSADGSEKLTNIAEMAKANGKKVGVVTTVAINHATPAAFSAHQKNRDMYYEIAQDMIANGFDFYGGSRIYNECETFDGKPADPIRPQFEAAGYTICNVEGFKENWQTADKILMLPAEGQSVKYRIDALNNAPEKNLTLKEMVESAVTFLMKDNKKGFFLMAEGGEIDHTCHSHDAAGTVQEVIDLDEAVKVAFEFYKKHPKQTLIVVTADHETGGLVLDPGKPKSFARLGLQKCSKNAMTDQLRQMMADSDKPLSWEQVKAFISENTGLWKEIGVSWEDEKAIRDIYEVTLAKQQSGHDVDLYSDNDQLISKAVEIANDKCSVHWHGHHTACYTPVFAIGAGSSLFTHKTDNAEVPMLIKQAAAYK